MDWDLGPGHRFVQKQLNVRYFCRLITMDQTFVQAMQAPDIAGMLTGTAKSGIES